MNRDQLIESSKEVIANGVGCDRWCESDEGKRYPCGCRENACTIIAMTVNAASNVCYNMNNDDCGDAIQKEYTP